MNEDITKIVENTLTKEDSLGIVKETVNASYKAGQKLGDKLSDGIDWLVDSIFG